jgi:transposase
MGVGSQRNLDAYEARRLKGIELFEQGYRASEIAGRTGVSRQAVSQWLQRWRRGGKSALARVKHKGRPSRLTPEQRRRLAGMLREGATAHGYPNDLWSGRRVSRLIWDAFGVRPHPKHIPRLLRALGWTYQKPTGGAVERDEAAIARWVARDGPRIKKKSSGNAPRSCS